MKKTYYTIVYIVLSLTALVMASGAPLAFGGSGTRRLISRPFHI